MKIYWELDIDHIYLNYDGFSIRFDSVEYHPDTGFIDVRYGVEDDLVLRITNPFVIEFVLSNSRFNTEKHPHVWLGTSSTKFRFV